MPPIQKSASSAALASQHSTVNATASNIPLPSPRLSTMTTSSTESESLKTMESGNKAAEISVGSPKFPIDSGLFRQRLFASKKWLREAPQTNYTVQLGLVDASNDKQIKQFLKRVGVELDIEQVHLYPTRIGGNARFGIVYSSFGSRDEALRNRIALEKKWNYRGQLRTVAGLRLEMQRTHSDDLWLK
jgi:septal ring-binding cell division protein DamX